MIKYLKYYWNKLVCLYYLKFTSGIIKPRVRFNIYRNFDKNFNTEHTDFCGICGWLMFELNSIVYVYDNTIFKKCFPELYFYKPLKSKYLISGYWFEIYKVEPRQEVINKAKKLLKKYKKL